MQQDFIEGCQAKVASGQKYSSGFDVTKLMWSQFSKCGKMVNFFTLNNILRGLLQAAELEQSS